MGAAEGAIINEPNPTQMRARGVPAGRWGRVQDIALAAVYMCTPAAGWITATRLTIDGGSAHRVSSFQTMKDAIVRKSNEQKEGFKGKGGVAKL